jgi:hypothetical protein
VHRGRHLDRRDAEPDRSRAPAEDPRRSVDGDPRDAHAEVRRDAPREERGRRAARKAREAGLAASSTRRTSGPLASPSNESAARRGRAARRDRRAPGDRRRSTGRPRCCRGRRCRPPPGRRVARAIDVRGRGIIQRPALPAGASNQLLTARRPASARTRPAATRAPPRRVRLESAERRDPRPSAVRITTVTHHTRAARSRARSSPRVSSRRPAAPRSRALRRETAEGRVHLPVVDGRRIRVLRIRPAGSGRDSRTQDPALRRARCARASRLGLPSARGAISRPASSK